MIKKIGSIIFFILLVCISQCSFAQEKVIHFVFCSDLHFGLTKPVFRGQANVSSIDVNLAMVAKLNELPSHLLPNDGGIGANSKIGALEGVIITGDICNREETGVQSATASWKEFTSDYVDKLHLLNKEGQPSQLLLTPGNHDISNAIGFHRPMQPLRDNAPLVAMYNMMMKPPVQKTAAGYNFNTDKIHYSVNVGGIHMMFVSAWPDSSERLWMQYDLNQVPAAMPAFIFTHSDPAPEARFFQNPNGDYSINPTDKFENLVAETFKGGFNVKDSTVIEQRGLVAFLQEHPNIKAYFHGHTNYAEFYDWKGPDNTINLPCFRADSPMKGRASSKDETQLSFNVISIDKEKKIMTVRECLWNAHPEKSIPTIEWGLKRTIAY